MSKKIDMYDAKFLYNSAMMNPIFSSALIDEFNNNFSSISKLFNWDDYNKKIVCTFYLKDGTSFDSICSNVKSAIIGFYIESLNNHLSDILSSINLFIRDSLNGMEPNLKYEFISSSFDILLMSIDKENKEFTIMINFVS